MSEKGTAVFPPTSLSWLAVGWTTLNSESDLIHGKADLFLSSLAHPEVTRTNEQIHFLSISPEAKALVIKRPHEAGHNAWVFVSVFEPHAWGVLQELAKAAEDDNYPCASLLVSSERHWCLQTLLWVFVCVRGQWFLPEITAIYSINF